VKQSIAGSLGLAAKAGCIAAGASPVTQALRKGRAKLVILSPEAGDATRRKFAAMAETASTPCFTAQEAIGPAIGQAKCVVAAVTNIKMAANIQKIVNCE